MRTHRRLERSDVRFNMTPMIDVVFLLIIFFLVSSHLAQREKRLPVELPQVASGQKDSVDQQPRTTLTITSDGAYYLAGNPTDATQLVPRLRRHREQHGENLELRIRCDRNVAYGMVAPVLRSSAEAEIWRVTFAVLQRERTR